MIASFWREILNDINDPSQKHEGSQQLKAMGEYLQKHDLKQSSTSLNDENLIICFERTFFLYAIEFIMTSQAWSDAYFNLIFTDLLFALCSISLIENYLNEL